jgi:exodeoxyribonuclease III
LVRKHAVVGELAPDVLVVPECGRIGGLNQGIGLAPVRSVEWVGDDPHKGLGVISYGEYSLRVHAAYEPRHRWVLPLEVEGPIPLTLFAVWTVPHPESRLYVHCLFEALETYSELLRSPRVVWAGDFNCNPRFDKPSHRFKFQDLVPRLEALGLVSLYHLRTGEPHGEERQPTFFLQRNPAKPHHIDFIFASESLRGSGFDLSVGENAEWSRLSDHMPLVASIR